MADIMLTDTHDDLGDGQAGTTLAELLVVIVLFTVVGLITTTGIVQGLTAQQSATNVAETLDGMRLATQRVRDFVREADEVCASSTDRQLVLWTDDNSDDVQQDTELDIFEIDTTVTPPIFRRRVPASGEVQIIRDDILDDAIFSYDVDVAPDGTVTSRSATDQPADLKCLDGASVTDTVSRIRSVQVSFIVDHPDPAEPDLTTSTSVRIRNADLVAKPNTAPDAQFTFDCPVSTQTCSFDASTSTDPDGSIVTWSWDFGDGAVASGVTASRTYLVGDKDYDVTLLVVDNEGAVDTIKRTVRPSVTTGNPKPVADFTPSCTGLICNFDGSASTDNGSVAQWRWDFGDGSPVQTRTTPVYSNKAFGSPGTYAVTLVVVDNQGALSDPVTKSVTVGSNIIRVESITPTIANKSNQYDVTFKVQLSRTTTGAPGAGVTISVKLEGGKKGNDSCSTNASGSCTITVLNIPNNKTQSLEVTNVTDSTSTFAYDPAQDKYDRVVVDKNGNKTYFKDGVEVIP